jgi:hypothetical protein
MLYLPQMSIYEVLLGISFGGVGLIFLIGNYKTNSKSKWGNVSASTIRQQQRNSWIFTRIVDILLQEICV